MKDLMNLFLNIKLYFSQDEKGQTLVEYALILVLIAIVVIAMLTATGTAVNNTFSTVANELN